MHVSYCQGMRIGLALGGGGLTGTAFHAGVLTALADVFDSREAALIVGTSAGSTSAALMRAGFPPRDYVARVCGEPLSQEGRAILGTAPPLTAPKEAGARQPRPASVEVLKTVARRPWRYPPGVSVSGLLPAGTRPMDGVGLFRGIFNAWPADPMWIVTVDLEAGRRVVFGRDRLAPVADAVAASCAVPGYYEPVAIEGRRYVDGGAWSMASLDLLADQDLDLVICSAPMSTADWFARDFGNAARVPWRAQLDHERRKVAGRVLIVSPDARMRRVMGTSAMDADRRAPVAKAALEYAREVFTREGVAV